jgi:hypothetical protein
MLDEETYQCRVSLQKHIIGAFLVHCPDQDDFPEQNMTTGLDLNLKG